MNPRPEFLTGTISEHLERADAFSGRVFAWAEARENVRALAVVGSYARGEARSDSDLDLMLLTRDSHELVTAPSRIHLLGDVARFSIERYGRAASIRVHFQDGLEAELTIVADDWAQRPYDAGTLRVALGGMKVLFDRDGDATRLARDVAPLPSNT